MTRRPQRWLPALAVVLAACGSRPVLAGGPAPAASTASLPRLVTTEELARWQAEGPVLLLDVRTDVFAYLRGHLPGAMYLNTESLRATRGGIPAWQSSGVTTAPGCRYGAPTGATPVILTTANFINVPGRAA